MRQISKYTKIKLVDKDIKAVIVTLFLKYKNLKERLSMLSRDMEGIQKKLELEKYIYGEKYTESD